MPNDRENALVFVDEAIEALSIKMWHGTAEQVASDTMERADPIEATIAVELERIDSALGPRGRSMFFPLAERIKQAMSALHGAKQSLEGGSHA